MKKFRVLVVGLAAALIVGCHGESDIKCDPISDDLYSGPLVYPVISQVLNTGYSTGNYTSLGLSSLPQFDIDSPKASKLKAVDRTEEIIFDSGVSTVTWEWSNPSSFTGIVTEEVGSIRVGDQICATDARFHGETMQFTTSLLPVLTRHQCGYPVAVDHAHPVASHQVASRMCYTIQAGDIAYAARPNGLTFSVNYVSMDRHGHMVTTHVVDPLKVSRY